MPSYRVARMFMYIQTKGLGMGKVDVLCGHLECITAIWYIGNLVAIWYIFGILCQEKSGHPAVILPLSPKQPRFNKRNYNFKIFITRVEKLIESVSFLSKLPVAKTCT
jgi:hypothetical protein